MDNEEKYKKLIRAIKVLRDMKPHDECLENWIKENAPEIAESEDEKVRKALIELVDCNERSGYTLLNNISTSSMLAWLEKQGEERKITHEEICKSYGIPDIGEFSDGYHTFNGLYKQRMILFAVLVKTYKDRAWKSWKHEDGLDCFGGGWFIVGIDTPAGTYTYHYEAKDWDRFDCQILEKAKHWDGHDEFDVERLFSLVSNANKDEVIRCLINGMKFYYEDNEEATWGTEKFSMKVKDILSWLEKQEPKKHEAELDAAYKTADKVQYRRGYEAAMKEMGQYRMQNGIIINGVEYELIKDEIEGKKEGECIRCALNELCNNKDDAICNFLFGFDLAAHRRFEEKHELY